MTNETPGKVWTPQINISIRIPFQWYFKFLKKPWYGWFHSLPCKWWISLCLDHDWETKLSCKRKEKRTTNNTWELALTVSLRRRCRRTWGDLHSNRIVCPPAEDDWHKSAGQGCISKTLPGRLRIFRTFRLPGKSRKCWRTRQQKPISSRIAIRSCQISTCRHQQMRHLQVVLQAMNLPYTKFSELSISQSLSPLKINCYLFSLGNSFCRLHIAPFVMVVHELLTLPSTIPFLLRLKLSWHLIVWIPTITLHIPNQVLISWTSTLLRFTISEFQNVRSASQISHKTGHELSFN